MKLMPARLDRRGCAAGVTRAVHSSRLADAGRDCQTDVFARTASAGLPPTANSGASLALPVVKTQQFGPAGRCGKCEPGTAGRAAAGDCTQTFDSTLAHLSGGSPCNYPLPRKRDHERDIPVPFVPAW